MDTIPIKAYYGISFDQSTQVQMQQFNPGEVIARHKNQRLFDRRTFSISLPINNKNEVNAFLKSKRGSTPFRFGYDNLVYTCNQYSFTYLAFTGDQSCKLTHQFEATLIRENN